MKFKYCVIHQLVLSGSLIFPTLSFADSDSTKTTPNKASYLEEISVVATTVQHIFPQRNLPNNCVKIWCLMNGICFAMR